jgi:hypothetical protein
VRLAGLARKARSRDSVKGVEVMLVLESNVKP